jgi:hypothetical protein
MSRILVVLVVALIAAQAVAQSAPESPLAALASGDCQRIGAAVNHGIDSKSPAAYYVAAVLHDEGLCIEKSQDRAAQFYRAAVDAGDARAALEIGLRYAFGDILPQSYTRAGSWLWHAENLARGTTAPRALDLPPEKIDPTTEWQGYLRALHLYAARIVKYPIGARIDGAELDLVARVCPTSDSIQVTVTGQSAAPVTAGVARSSGRREIVLATQDAYEKALSTLPRIKRPDSESRECMQRPINFRLR